MDKDRYTALLASLSHSFLMAQESFEMGLLTSTVLPGLPAMFEKEDVVIHLDELPPEQAQQIKTAFGEFCPRLLRLVQPLSRFVVDEKAGTLTITGHEALESYIAPTGKRG